MFLHQVKLPSQVSPQDGVYLHRLFQGRYEAHRTISRWFRGEKPPVYYKQGNVLYVVSELERPSFNQDEQYLLEDSSRVRSLDGITFRAGQYLKVQIHLNAVYSDDSAVWARARAQGRNPREALREWCLRKLEQAGFETSQVGDNLTVDAQGQESVRKPVSGRKALEIPVQPVVVNAVLQVREPEKVIEHYKAGLGQGKAWGFGLLRLAKA